jgi:protein-tyrosine phosphatase
MRGSVQRVMVESDGAGSLTLSWEIDGAATAVDVAVGPTPNRIDHVHARRVDAGTTELQLDDLGPGRHFVSVSVNGSGGGVVAADRRLPLEGLQNFRDIGGYPTNDGGTTRWGLVFRADSLHKLTPADLATCEALGMKSVYDLRGDDERATHPNPFDNAVQLAIVGRPADDDEQPRSLDARQANTDGERILRDIYIGMLEHSAPLFGRLFTGLLDDDRLPAVFHCHAGKDRTGVAAALLLAALGVDRETILDDYELTARYRRFEHQQDSYERLLSIGMTPEAAAGVLTAPRWAMSDALDALDETHGGIETYLTGRAGLQPADLERLRATLTEQALVG